MKENGSRHTKEDMLKLIKRLTKVPSVSGTEGENVMAAEILSILKGIPYFQEYPENVFEEQVVGDSLGRKTLGALLKGKAEDTVVLLSHYDVVGVEDYGYLQEYAFDPDAYMGKLKAEVLPEDVRMDLESGDYWFARGVMDMKAGLAIQISLLAEWAGQSGFEGNILLLVTPDEERNSEGMFAGVRLLKRLKEKYRLNYQLGLCSEPSFAAYPGDQSNYIYLGSAGKLLPLIFCNGRETHVGEPLEGVNASWMASMFTSQMELSTEFCDHVGKDQSPPPVCLKLADLKERYNVQTPTHAYALYNVLTLSQSPGEVMDKLVHKARRSADEIYQRLEDAYQASGLGKNNDRLRELKPKVFTYSQLYELGKERYQTKFTEEIEGLLIKWTDTNYDFRELTVELAKVISGYFPDLAPFYLIMFAPPYYPHVFLQESSPSERRLIEIVKAVQEKAKSYRTELRMQNYFMGLSDVSYFRLLKGEEVVSVLPREMPLFGKRYRLPLKEIQELNIPTINLGPFGKDAHKRTERLEISYSTETLPHLLKYTVELVLGMQGKE